MMAGLLTRLLSNRVESKSKGLEQTLSQIYRYLYYFEERSHSNASYVENLHSIIVTKLDRSTISRWFNNYFPISGRFWKPNMVSIDMFKPINMIKAEEYISILSIVAPNKLRFGDKKLIKGAEVYCRRTRRNVFTGMCDIATLLSSKCRTLTPNSIMNRRDCTCNGYSSRFPQYILCLWNVWDL